VLPLFSGDAERVLAFARRAEERGFDGVFAFDHLFPPGAPADRPSLEAFASLTASPGARAYYNARRAGGDGHHQALRSLGNRLVGILHGCLQHHTTYNETTAWAHRPDNELKAAAILVFTRHGHMARHTGWLRPRYSPVYAMTALEESARALSLCWGVIPFVVPFDMINPENTIEAAVKSMLEQSRLHKGDTVVIIGSILVGDQIVDAVQMRVV